MRTDAPPDFKADEFYSGVYLFQTWDVFPGHTARGVKSVQETLLRLKVPARLDGLRILEIAPWNGFFGFECLRRGAREVVALGPDDPTVTGFARTAELLGAEDSIQYIRGSVYDIAKYDLGVFDVVFCLGLIYHLRHPLLAIDLLHDHCNEQAIFLIDSATMNPVGRIMEESTAPSNFVDSWEGVQKYPLSLFVRGTTLLPAGQDGCNWFFPNAECLNAWVRSSGFEIVHESSVKGWHYIHGRKAKRAFPPGLEGYNPNVARK